jgi:hypothetical protein
MVKSFFIFFISFSGFKEIARGVESWAWFKKKPS